MSAILGIDPGLNGALAFLSATGALEVHDMPTVLVRGSARKPKRSVDVVALARLIDEANSFETIAAAYLEGPLPMPNQSSQSTLQTGIGWGQVYGVLTAHFIPVTVVRPGEWKKALRVPAAKDGAIVRASELLPRHRGQWPLKKHDGRAEAALIALYGQRDAATGRAAA